MPGRASGAERPAEPHNRFAPRTRRHRREAAHRPAPRPRSARAAPARRGRSTAARSRQPHRRLDRRRALKVQRSRESSGRRSARRQQILPAARRGRVRRRGGARRPRAGSLRRWSRARADHPARRPRGMRRADRTHPRRACRRRRRAASRRPRERLSASDQSKLLRVSALRIERDGPLLRVTLARPERRNAFDAELIRELTEAFSDVGDARAVLLAGDGESFCAGADVDWQRSAIDLSYEENVEDALRLYRMLEKIDACPAPVVGRVQGYALGGGSGLVCCTDVAVAAPDAVFGFSEVKLGIVPAVISPFVFPRIGTAAARRFFLTGERFDAETALRIGLVQELAPDLDAAIERVAGELLSAGPEATRAAKQLIRERPGGEEAARLAAKLRTSPEGQEGLRAFLDKRPAAWRSGSSS